MKEMEKIDLVIDLMTVDFLDFLFLLPPLPQKTKPKENKKQKKNLIGSY